MVKFADTCPLCYNQMGMSSKLKKQEDGKYICPYRPTEHVFVKDEKGYFKKA